MLSKAGQDRWALIIILFVSSNIKIFLFYVTLLLWVFFLSASFKPLINTYILYLNLLFKTEMSN